MDQLAGRSLYGNQTQDAPAVEGEQIVPGAAKLFEHGGRLGGQRVGQDDEDDVGIAVLRAGLHAGKALFPGPFRFNLKEATIY